MVYVWTWCLFLARMLRVVYSQVPHLSELGGQWRNITSDQDPPAISNWKCSVGILTSDVLDASAFICPPMLAAPSMLTLKIDHRDVECGSTQWRAYEANRLSKPWPVIGNKGESLLVKTSLRLVFNETALMWTIHLRKVSAQALSLASAAAEGGGIDSFFSPTPKEEEGEGNRRRRQLVDDPSLQKEEGKDDRNSSMHTVEISAITYARELKEMGWIVQDTPNDPEDFSTTVFPPEETSSRQQRWAMVLHQDKKTQASSGFIFANYQPLTSPPSLAWQWRGNESIQAAVGHINVYLPTDGEGVTIKLVAAMEEEGKNNQKKEKKKPLQFSELAQRLENYAEHFDRYWEEAHLGWEEHWQNAFIPYAERRERTRQESTREEGGGGKEEKVASSLFVNPLALSGHVPTLRTPDDNVRQVYYMSILTLLAVGKHHLPALQGNGYLTAFGNTCWVRPDVLSSTDRNIDADCLKPIYPRLTSLKPVYIGATAQFFWDTALRAYLTSLLDPLALRRYILAALRLPEGAFAKCFGLDSLNGKPIGYEYAFNSHSIFTMITAYIRVTNDTALLTEEVDRGVTVDQRLEEVAMDWQHRRMLFSQRDVVPPPLSTTTTTTPSSSYQSYLADYGGDIDTFLECIPSYIHAPAALQAANVEMMSWMANLRQSQGNASGAAMYHDYTQAIGGDLLSYMYEEELEGAWACLYPKAGGYEAITVRHVIDFIYVTRGLSQASRILSTLPPLTLNTSDSSSNSNKGFFLTVEMARQMRAYFHRELSRRNWVRALSLTDPLHQQIPRAQGPLRPDHGVTGAYTAWVALAIEALTLLPAAEADDTQNNTSAATALSLLQSVGWSTTGEGPYGQAHSLLEITTEQEEEPPQVYKPKSGYTRYTADNGGSFAEMIIRGFFQYQPLFYNPVNESLPFRGLEHAFFPPHPSSDNNDDDTSSSSSSSAVQMLAAGTTSTSRRGENRPPRSFQGRLENLPTNYGLATIQVDEEGRVTILDLK